MTYPSIFLESSKSEAFARLDALTATTPRQWGSMTCAQMLAHLSVPYEYTFGERSDVPPWIMRTLVKLFFRKLLVGAQPYAKGTRTAPSMIMSTEKDFEHERSRLKAYIQRVFDEGAPAFEGRTQVTLGSLTAEEWSTLFAKHFDHHLRQFGR